MKDAAAATYVLDPDYRRTDEDMQLIDSICAHVRKHPKLYESAVHEIDHGRYSFESLKADRADFEAAAKKDDARAKKVARKKGQPTHRSWLKQNALNPRFATDWAAIRRRKPEVVDLLRIHAVRDELLMDWSGMPGSWRGPASADRLAISTLKSQVIFVMTSVLFDPDDHDGKARASLQKVPWNGPPLAGRRAAERVMSGRGEVKIWIEMVRRAASKLKFPVPIGTSENSAVAKSSKVKRVGARRVRTKRPAPDPSKAALSLSPRRKPLTENARRIAAALIRLPEGQGLTLKEIPRKTGVARGSVSRVLRELRPWGVKMGLRGTGAHIVDEAHWALLKKAVNAPS